jgi:Holliday junction resolvasome RuvABC endonuclease subunit
MTEDTNTILSLFPYARGIGYVCLKPPQGLLDSGIVTIRPISNERILGRINKFVEFHRPTLVILREPDTGHSERAKRVHATIEAIVDYAKEQGLPVHRYTRDQIQEAFEVHGAKSKQDITKQLLVWFPELSYRAPKIRKTWMDEDYNMCMFDALALAVTHLHFVK